jgi:hypothetical protein
MRSRWPWLILWSNRDMCQTVKTLNRFYILFPLEPTQSSIAPLVGEAIGKLFVAGSIRHSEGKSLKSRGNELRNFLCYNCCLMFQCSKLDSSTIFCFDNWFYCCCSFVDVWFIAFIISCAILINPRQEHHWGIQIFFYFAVPHHWGIQNFFYFTVPSRCNFFLSCKS